MSEQKKRGRPSKTDLLLGDLAIVNGQFEGATKDGPSTQVAGELNKQSSQKLVKVRFKRDICKLSQEELHNKCYREIYVRPGKKEYVFDAFLQHMVLQDKNNFFLAGKEYEIPESLFAQFSSCCIKFTHVDNSKAKSVSEVVAMTDAGDPRIKTEIPIVEKVES